MSFKLFSAIQNSGYLFRESTDEELASVAEPFEMPAAFCPHCGSDDIRYDSNIVSTCRACDFDGPYWRFLAPEEEDYRENDSCS